MSVSYHSHVVMSADSGLDWGRAPELIARALPQARVTVQPASRLAPQDLAPVRAAWPDDYELWFYPFADVRQFAEDLLLSVQLSDSLTHDLDQARSTGSLRVEISGRNDFPDGGDHFNDWVIATEALSALPGAFDLDQAMVDEAPRRRTATHPAPPSYARNVDPETDDDADGRPWWRRLLG